jgi:hypothetical protein
MSMPVSQSLPPALSRFFTAQIQKRERVVEMSRFCAQSSHDFNSFLLALLETIDYLETEKINPILQEYFHQGVASLQSKEITYDLFCHGMLELFSERIRGRDLNLIFVAIEQYLSLRVAPYIENLVGIIQSEKGRMQIDEEAAQLKGADIRMVQIMLLKLIPFLEKSKREFAFSNCKEALEDFLPPSFSSVSSCPFSLIDLEERIHESIAQIEKMSAIKKSIEVQNLTKIKLVKKLEESGHSAEDHAMLIDASEQEGRLYQQLRFFSRVQPLSLLLKTNLDRMIDSERASYQDVEEFLKFAKFLMTVQSTILVMQKSHLSSTIEALESNFNMLSEGLPAILGSPCSFELGGYLTTKFLEEVEIISSEAKELGVDCSFVEFEDAIEIEEISDDVFVKIARLNKKIEHVMFQGNTADEMRETLAELEQTAFQIIQQRESEQEREIPLLLEIQQYLKAQSQLPFLDQDTYVQTLSQANELLCGFLEHVRPKELSMEDVLDKVRKIKISFL